MENDEPRVLKMSEDFSTVENSPLWRREEDWFPITLTPGQFESLKRGYKPDWECRYEPHFINGCIYISRSGFWVKKYPVEHFREEWGDEVDEYYRIEDAYSTDGEFGRPLLAELLLEGYFEPPIWTVEDSKIWFEVYERSKNAKPVIDVYRKPRKCAHCGSTSIAKIVYGMRFGALKENEVDGGCETTPNDPHWVCKECGQCYRRKFLKSIHL